jgi:CheY-like chemotaxis protein
MLDQEDLKWIARGSTNLNSVLQQIARYTDLARRHKGEHHYLDLLGDRVDLGAKIAQTLFDRVTSTILTKTTGNLNPPAAPPAILNVVPLPVQPISAWSLPAARAVFGGAQNTQVAPANGGVKSAMALQTEVPVEIQVKNPKGNREYVLIVEDDLEIADLAAEMLTDEGYKVILARDGFNALQIYQKMGKQIGLVILDFFLPVMDGDAVFDELRALNPNIDVVLSSGFAEQDKISSMLAQGLRGFIPKPYTREKLLAQVRSTLDAARQALR